ncbi:hypothetical protein GCM10028868_20020 [Virgibacillus kimchii]
MHGVREGSGGGAWDCAEAVVPVTPREAVVPGTALNARPTVKICHSPKYVRSCRKHMDPLLSLTL